MKKVNCYYEGYNESDKRIDFLKYGLINEFGHNISKGNVKTYNEDDIIKKSCNKRIK